MVLEDKHHKHHKQRKQQKQPRKASAPDWRAVCQNTLDPTHVTARLEKDKLEKHGDAARKLGMKLMPIAFTTFGGMGDVFLKSRWRPFFKELMDKELKEGGLGWKTRKQQQRALEKLSIVLARENGAMIARATSWQQAVATRP